MGNRKSKSIDREEEDQYLLMDRRRPFNTPSGTQYSSCDSSSTFSTDLFMKIGTRVATITAVYERITTPTTPTTPNRANLPLPPLPTVSSTAVDNDGYEVPKVTKR